MDAFIKLCQLGNLENIIEYNEKNQCLSYNHECSYSPEFKEQLRCAISPTDETCHCNEFAFCTACCFGHTEVAKWLLCVKPDINISVNNDATFRVTCQYGCLSTAQWLLSLKPDIDISAGRDFAFRLACTNGHIETARWLLSVKPDINISSKNEYAFRLACTNGYLEVAQWLLSIKPTINILAKKNFVFQTEHTSILKWLWKVNPLLFKCLLPINDEKKIKMETVDENETLCPICFETTVKLQTNCEHNFCGICLMHFANFRKIKEFGDFGGDDCCCPYCKTKITTCYIIS